MNKFRSLFPKKCSVIGMIHVKALPGTPKYVGPLGKVIDKACNEADIYLASNIDGLLIENMHDIPYVQSEFLSPETTSIMTRICTEVRKLSTSIPCGVQILAGGNKEALATALAANLNFIRAEGFVFSHIADEGLMNACAGQLLRYRKQIEAENISIFTDIKKKHSSHAITSDVTLEETAKAAEFFLSDGLILTGTSTGSAAKPEELKSLKKCSQLPLLVGSGVTLENCEEYFTADAFIIGSHFKKGGLWQNDIDANRIKTFMHKINEFRSQ